MKLPSRLATKEELGVPSIALVGAPIAESGVSLG